MTDSDIDSDKYKRLLRIIYHQTGGSSLPVAIPESAIGLIFRKHIGYGSETYDTAVKKAVAEEHIIRIDLNDEIRTALTVSGLANIQKTTPYTEANIDRMQTLVEIATCIDPDDKTVWGWMNDHRNYFENI